MEERFFPATSAQEGEGVGGCPPLAIARGRAVVVVQFLRAVVVQGQFYMTILIH